MTFEQWMDRQYGKNWGVTMAVHANPMKDAFLAGRREGRLEVERDAREEVRDAVAQARHEERYPDEPYGTY